MSVTDPLVAMHSASTGGADGSDGGFGWFGLLVAGGIGFAIGSWGRNPFEGPKKFSESTSRGIARVSEGYEKRRAR